MEQWGTCLFGLATLRRDRSPFTRALTRHVLRQRPQDALLQDGSFGLLTVAGKRSIVRHQHCVYSGITGRRQGKHCRRVQRLVRRSGAPRRSRRRRCRRRQARQL